MKKSNLEQQEQWNKAILGFFLAVQNEQAKAANFFLKTFELLRLIVGKIITNAQEIPDASKNGLKKDDHFSMSNMMSLASNRSKFTKGSTFINARTKQLSMNTNKQVIMPEISLVNYEKQSDNYSRVDRNSVKDLGAAGGTIGNNENETEKPPEPL